MQVKSPIRLAKIRKTVHPQPGNAEKHSGESVNLPGCHSGEDCSHFLMNMSFDSTILLESHPTEIFVRVYLYLHPL